MKATGGFTLVEITLAIGIVGFCLLSILGTLPVELATVREAVVQVGESGIARQIRAQLEQVTPSSISILTNTTNYYTQQGTQVFSSDPANFKNAYYSATFVVTDPVVTGSATNFNSSARTITVTLHYPQIATAQQQTKIFSLLASVTAEPSS